MSNNDNIQANVLEEAPYGVLVKGLRPFYVWKPVEGDEYDEEGFDSSLTHRNGDDTDDDGYDYFGVDGSGFRRGEDKHWLAWNYEFGDAEERADIRKMLPEVLDDFTMETVLESIGEE